MRGPRTCSCSPSWPCAAWLLFTTIRLPPTPWFASASRYYPTTQEPARRGPGATLDAAAHHVLHVIGLHRDRLMFPSRIIAHDHTAFAHVRVHFPHGLQ